MDFSTPSQSPGNIEQESFAIIRKELAVPPDPELAPVILRCIHTSADFEYAESLYFSPQVMAQARQCFQDSPIIITDTNMTKSGINRQALSTLGARVECFVADQDVAEAARENGTTRSREAVNKAARLSGNLVFVFGNAPTALLRLVELIQGGRVQPRLVIGVPVGFVHVVEAKQQLMACHVPMIVNRGRKGGSNIAAAIVNALMYDITRKE